MDSRTPERPRRSLSPMLVQARFPKGALICWLRQHRAVLPSGKTKPRRRARPKTNRRPHRPPAAPTAGKARAVGKGRVEGMAIFHLAAKVVSRKAGQSVVAKAAYNAREELTEERTGEVKDYTRAEGLLFSGLYAPANAPEWTQDRAKLWNEVNGLKGGKIRSLPAPSKLIYRTNSPTSKGAFWCRILLGRTSPARATLLM